METSRLIERIARGKDSKCQFKTSEVSEVTLARV